jgi:glutamine synthetase
MTDMQGRLQGKRMAADFFLAEAVAHGGEGCGYLLAVDVDMNTVDGYAVSSWDSGYGDLVMVPDLATLRLIPWHPGTVMVQCDVTFHDGTPVPVSPRQVLRRQLDRLAAYGWDAYVGTELEFIVFKDTYEQAWDKDYRGLIPANQYNVDYSVLGTGRVEPLLRRIRNEMAGAGLVVESAKGECNPGQHEIAFKYGKALNTCDDHSVYKTGPTGSPRSWSTSWPGSSRACPTSPCCSPRTSTPTSATSPGASRPPPSHGAVTTARARCGLSGTARPCASKTASPAAT